MINYIHPQVIVNSYGLFVREPVDDAINKIYDSSANKIIVNGGRGSGKSVLLLSLEDKGLDKDNQTIYTEFNTINSFASEPNELFNERLFIHYYELLFSLKLLNYIDEYYPKERNYFSDIRLLLENLLKYTLEYINDGLYVEKSLSRYLSFGEISQEILDKLNKYLNISKLNIIIDRFDWVKSNYTQELLSKYFTMFNKSIITTDDETIDFNRKEDLSKKGYEFHEITYCKDINFIKEIIKRRIKRYNNFEATEDRKFDINILTEDIYQELVVFFDGNIRSMLIALGEGIEAYLWDKNAGIDNAFDYAINDEINRVEKIKSIQLKPKLYL